jgi:hypothetical protein
MRKILYSLSTVLVVLFFISCKKSDSGSSASAKTVANLSGTYKITAINVFSMGVNFDGYAQLKDCEKDNIITLQNTLEAVFNDAGIVCSPSEESTGTWSLSSNSDSLSVYGLPTYPNGITGFITSWNGTTLVLTANVVVVSKPSTVTLTLFKQ